MKTLKAYINRFMKSRFIRRILLLTTIFIILVFIIDTFIMPWYVNKSGTLTVPNVVGMKEENAKRLLDSLHMEPRRGDIRSDNRYPEGFVVFQNPPSEQIVKSGRRIYLTISGGEQFVLVPTLKGRTIRDSKFALDRVGLYQGGIAYKTSLEFPEGTIITQDLPPGSKVKRGTYIGITVSAGESVDSIFVPSLVGKTLSESQKILKEKGLRVGNIIYQINSDLLPNTVIDQLPREDEVVTYKKDIDLFISQAPEKPAPIKK
jgi:eukaryotic-like serine/threonine-protein kinase